MTLSIGIIGGIILILGAARYEKRPNLNPRKSLKNRFYAIGAAFMFTYSILGYIEGGSVFYILLESLVCIASILMMIDIDDKKDFMILGAGGTILIGLSFYFSQSIQTLWFTTGLIGLTLGYAFKPCTIRRDVMFTLGSILICVFSILESDRVFFGINLFFALFSAFYRLKHGIEKKK